VHLAHLVSDLAEATADLDVPIVETVTKVARINGHNSHDGGEPPLQQLRVRACVDLHR